MKNFCFFARIIFSFGLLTLSATSLANGNSNGKLKPLYFQANKNYLQVLPQRFEYTLMDEERMKVGDILIDANQITFQLIPSRTEKGRYSIRFTWPAGLLTEGEIALKNNSGKAIFSSTFSKKNIRISAGTSQEAEEILRSETAEFTADNIPGSLIEDMKLMPFMSFCIFRASEETRLYLCSKELYLTTQDGKIDIKPRSISKKTAQVEINGKVVGNQGIIFLNDLSETVSFTAQTEAGASLEIETRRQDVDFKDVVLDNDGKKISLIASGAEPVTEEKINKLSETEWQIDIPANRPVLYLKGEGDIPMRQEFYVKGPLPYERDRPYLSAKSPSRTYSSSLYLLGVAPEGMKITPANKSSQVEPQQKGQFLWTLQNIPSGTTTRYSLNTILGDRRYLVSYDVFRARPFEFFIGGNYQTPSGLIYGRADLQWWIENLFGSASSFTRLHWGLGLHRDQHLTNKDTEGNLDKTTLELMWRASEGFYMTDPTWGLTLPMQMISGDGFSTTAFGLGAFWQTPSAKIFKSMSDWMTLRGRYLPSGTGADVKLKSGMEAELMLSKNVRQSFSIQYGAGFEMLKFDPALTKENTQINLTGGVAWHF